MPMVSFSRRSTHPARRGVRRMDECRTRINADGDAECFRNLLVGRARLFRLGSVRGDAPDATQADRDSQSDQLALTAYGAHATAGDHKGWSAVHPAMVVVHAR
jgi:hypothetical protein